LFFGFFGFILQGEHIFSAILKTISLFSLSFPQLQPLDGIVSTFSTLSLFFSAINAFISIFLLTIILFFKDFLEQQHISKVIYQEHTLLFGLGEINRNYLNTLKHKSSQVLIVEQDSTNKYINEYREKGFAILIGDALSDFVQKKLNYDRCKNIIIALGTDRYNIEFAKYILLNYDAKSEVKIVVHIQNKNLEILFHTSFVEKNHQINIKTFSFYEEVAKKLFMQHSIDGDSFEYIQTNKPFKTILLGDGILLEKILFQIALVSHLPKENKHTIYIVNKDAKRLLHKLKKELYYHLDEGSFAHLEIVAKELDRDSLEFYQDSIWYDETLVNVIVGFNDERENLDLAVELYNRIYLQQAQDKTAMPKILFGVFNEMLLSKIINENKKEFLNFFTYGNTNTILEHKHLIDEEGDLLGKLVHYMYDGFLEGDETNYNKYRLVHYKTDEVMKKKIDNAWYNNASYNDKLSSIAQTKLIDMKLKALQLKRIKSKETSIEKLLYKNREIFDEQLDEEFNGYYSFPKEFDSTIFKNLIRMEHNRWNDYHYLNGFQYSKNKNKQKKLHNCLLPLEKFDTKDIQDSIIYDIYSFMFIPNYLAECGYELQHYKQTNNKGKSK
jgi:voltage-gated potassium channel Kch